MKKLSTLVCYGYEIEICSLACFKVSISYSILVMALMSFGVGHLKILLFQSPNIISASI